MKACWIGKNIGGVLGAPLEGRRGIFNVEFYTQDLKGNPPANDDLDLQLVWLNAVEKYGHNVNASILGEYWLSFITPNWLEYGSGKNNMRMGLLPPLSGYLENSYRDSCGCFIRSEIWACLAPGRPELAARYAYEDAIVDHSSDGLYGEIFCAAVQSAAFVEKDKYKLIDIGLSYIPEDCGVAKGIKAAIDAYKSGLDFIEATEPQIHELLQRSPYAVSYKFPAFNVVLDYMGDPYIKLNQGKKLKLTLTDSAILGYHNHQWFTVKWYTPEGVKVLPGKEGSFLLQATYKNKVELEFEILAESPNTSKVELVVDISVNGRHSNGTIKVILIQKI